MKSNDPDINWVKEPELGLSGRLYLPAILDGLKTTIGHLFGKKVTVQYPEQEPWEDREKYPQSFVLDELRCIYCGMCEEACPVDAIELTTFYDLTGTSREEMIFDKEKLLSVYDQTQSSPSDPSSQTVLTEENRSPTDSPESEPLPEDRQTHD